MCMYTFSHRHTHTFVIFIHTKNVVFTLHKNKKKNETFDKAANFLLAKILKYAITEP